MDAGTVFRWNNFPDPRYGTEIKARWFICLGDSGPFAVTITVYLCTTTTQIEKYQAGGPRHGHDHHVLKASPQLFDADCVIDFEEAPYAKAEQEILGNPDIEIKGRLDEQTLRMIWNRIVRSDRYSLKILHDIHASYNRIGITGIKKPK